MNRFRIWMVGALLFASCGVGMQQAKAQVYRNRQHYSSWTYHPQRQYYYRKYSYRPTVSYPSYQYHYCICYSAQHYPARRNYVYYYNPVKRVYWGRYDLEKKGYSMLAEKDRKAKLEDIPEKAFPKPGDMPVIPGSKDKVKISPIKSDDLPIPMGEDLPK